MKHENMRDSNFELLRLLCIFGIVTMHTFGRFIATATGINLIYGTLINALFNVGVSVFVLISGYCGIRNHGKKLFSCWFETLFYSVLSLIIMHDFNVISNISFVEMAKAFLPLSANKYWFISSYILLLCLSKYINMVSEKLSRSEFRLLLGIMILIFCLIPTIVMQNIMKDAGKGPINMLIMYWIGRYIRLYKDEKYNSKMLTYSWIGVSLIIFCLNYGATIFMSIFRNGGGVYQPFARDYSIFIVTSSILVFMLFKNLKFSSNIVNSLSKHVLGMYLFDEAARYILDKFVNMQQYADKWYLFAVIALYVLAVLTVCLLVDTCRSLAFNNIERKVYEIILKWITVFKKSEIYNFLSRKGILDI